MSGELDLLQSPSRPLVGRRAAGSARRGPYRRGAYLYAIDADSGTIFGWGVTPVGSWGDLPTTVAGAVVGRVGVDGGAVTGDATAGVTTDDDTEVGTKLGVGPSDTGATGLDRANETPAAGHVPTSLPAATNGAGSQGSAGIHRANGTPAAGHIPASPGRP